MRGSHYGNANPNCFLGGFEILEAAIIISDVDDVMCKYHFSEVIHKPLNSLSFRYIRKETKYSIFFLVFSFFIL